MTPDGIAPSAQPIQAPAVRQGAPAPNREELRHLAQEFEALLMTQMLRDMRRSMVDEEDSGSGSGFGAMTDNLDLEFGRAMSAAGGVGLSSILVRAFDRLTAAVADPATVAPGSAATAAPPTVAAGPEVATAPTPDVSGPAADIAGGDVVPTRDGAPAGVAPLSPAHGRVTSAFGQRRDPLTGAQAFHQGVDIAMAYGQDVRAAAAGRVAFAGEDGGYGNMVSVLHSDGRETRYAHLSEQYVRAGDLVAPGQILGKSGSSGRSTGPHLHFETRVNGRPVDPTEVW